MIGTFTNVSVAFTQKEWEQLEAGQRNLHKGTKLENCSSPASMGKDSSHHPQRDRCNPFFLKSLMFSCFVFILVVVVVVGQGVLIPFNDACDIATKREGLLG